MSFSDKIKTMLRDDKEGIQTFQLAVTSGIATLIYSEYIKNFKQRFQPTRKVFVADMRYVKELVSRDGEFMKTISDKLVDYIFENLGKSEHGRTMKYFDDPDLKIFKEENIEITKTILELYILPNVESTIPRIIGAKFGLDTPQNQTFYVDGDIQLFGGHDPSEQLVEYVLEEILLHLYASTKSLTRSIKLVENNKEFSVTDYSTEIYCLAISNHNAIADILLNKKILGNDQAMDIIKFVTSTNFELLYDPAGEPYYQFSSDPFNTICSTIFD